MKKILFILIAVLGLLTISASAANVGDKISEAVYSDITAYINNYPMPCYVIDGYAVVVAEDLRNYCCDVYFDSSTRTLSITKSAGNTFTPPQVYKTSKETGEFYTDVLYTNIQTYVNNNWVKSFNVNGKTMIVIDEFGKYMDGYEWDGVNRAAKAYMTDKPQTEFKNVGPRTVMLFEQGSLNNFNSRINNYSGKFDFDFDGKQESIKITFSGKENPEYSAFLVSINGKNVKLEGGYYRTLEKIYITDIDANDGVWDLVIILSDMGWANLNIFKYDTNLTKYEFTPYDFWYEGKDETSLELGSLNPYFYTNDDGSITVKTQTTTSSMRWTVDRLFQRNHNGIFCEVVPSYYEILPEYRNNQYVGIAGYERSMWKNGYIKAYADYSNNGVIIKKGEYFSVLYDNGNGYVYIEKENGHNGWMYVDIERCYELNPYFFEFGA